MAMISRERGGNSFQKPKVRKTERKSMMGSVAGESSSADNYGLAIVIYGFEGVGKSSLMGFADNAFFLCGPQERGINILRKRGLVPSTISVGRPVESWQDTLDSLDEFAETDHSYKWLVVDGLSEIQRLAFEACCSEMYDGNIASKEGFLAFGTGPIATATGYWPELISRLDAIRSTGVNICLIAHGRVEAYKNPEGPDYDMFAPDLADPPKGASIYKMTSKWADAILFLKHNTEVSKDGTGKFAKNKGKGGESRIICTEACAVYKAKNRFGLGSVMGPYESAKDTWADLSAALLPPEKPKSKSVLPKRKA